MVNLWDYKLRATTNMFPRMGHEQKKIENPWILKRSKNARARNSFFNRCSSFFPSVRRKLLHFHIDSSRSAAASHRGAQQTAWSGGAATALHARLARALPTVGRRRDSQDKASPSCSYPSAENLWVHILQVFFFLLKVLLAARVNWKCRSSTSQ